jgi:hypothetical protein
VGTFVPAPQTIRWNEVAVYRVRLQRERPCKSMCYEAMLHDAAP